MFLFSVFVESLCWTRTLDKAVNQRFPWTRCTWVNKRKQSRGWSEVMGVMKYTLMRRDLSQLEAVWVSAILLSLRAAVAHCSFRLSAFSREAEMLSGVLKITQRALVERRYGSILQSVLPPSVCLSLSNITEASTPSEYKVWKIYSFKEVSWLFFLHIYSLILVHLHYPQSWQDPFFFLLLINSLSISSLGTKSLCTVINILFLWSICLSSFLVHFKDGPAYLTRRIRCFSLD